MTAQPQGVPDDESTETLQAPVHSPSQITANRITRLATAALGGALLTFGLKRRSLGGAAAGFAGGWLLYRGISGMRERREDEVSADEPAVERSITVGKPADELSEFWRDPEQLSRLVGHVAEVTSAGEDRHRWTVESPIGQDVTWETQIVEDQPGELLRWESVEDAVVPNEGLVRFRPAPGDRGTEVTLRLCFDPPGGPLGDAAMERLGIVPETLAGNALGRFKSLAESGEIPSLERNPSARGSGDLV